VTPPRAGVYRVRTTGGADATGSFQIALGDSIAEAIVAALARPW
jgi:hypothetical protein